MCRTRAADPVGCCGGAHPRGARRQTSGGTSRPRYCGVSRRSLSSGYRSDGIRKPLCPSRTRGSDGVCRHTVRGPGSPLGRARLISSRCSHPWSLDLALSDVGRATRGVVDAMGSCPICGAGRFRAEPRSPATLAFALSRRGLFYPLASLDISGQWPVFEQEPHHNERSRSPHAVKVPSEPSRRIVHRRRW